MIMAATSKWLVWMNITEGGRDFHTSNKLPLEMEFFTCYNIWKDLRWALLQGRLIIHSNNASAEPSITPPE
jgi:hypothetical protein